MLAFNSDFPNRTGKWECKCISLFSGCLEDYLRESEVELTYQRHYTLNSLVNSHENNQIFKIRCFRPHFTFANEKTGQQRG